MLLNKVNLYFKIIFLMSGMSGNVLLFQILLLSFILDNKV